MKLQLDPLTIRTYLKWLKKPTALYFVTNSLAVDNRGREIFIELSLPALPLSELPARQARKKATDALDQLTDKESKR